MTTTAAAFVASHSPFSPRRWLANGHAMTVYAWGRRRPFPSLPPPDPILVRVSPDTEVLAHAYWQADRAAVPTLLALHGLEGSSDAHYMRGLAAKAWARGWNAVLLNQRNCGGTEHLTPGLYHSGLTEDPRRVIRTLAERYSLPAFGVVGYSLGGNLAIKLAGELEHAPDLPLLAAVAVSPIIDIERCVRAIERRANVVYEFNFVRHLKRRMRRKVAAWPGSYDLGLLDSIWTIRKFDDVYTAPAHGFDGASDYYFRASALRVIDRIRIPSLIVSAADDPFVPPAQFLEPVVRDNPHVAVAIEAHGGHCAFAAAPNGDDDGYWAETTAVRFLATCFG
jgi:predicted alpha/beta-fold hydrolase